MRIAASSLAARLTGEFPACLNHMPLLLPGEDFAVRAKLMQWLHMQVPRLRVVGEFDDSAMIRAFGEAGAGLFFAPIVTSEADTGNQAGVQLVGTIPALREQVYAITTERRLSHPATQAISQAARQTLSA